MVRHTLAALMVVGAVILPGAVSAQQMACGPTEAVREELWLRHGEYPSARGLTPDGLLMEMWVSSERSWTLTLSTNDGMTCLLRSGADFEPIMENLVPGVRA